MTTQTQDDRGHTALITGASAGIGEALAHVFARNGFNVVLTARREDRLTALAASLKQQYGVEATAIAADLADSQAPQQIFDATQARGLTIDALINNAGYGVPGHFTTNTWDRHRDFIQVLMIAVAHLSHLYLPGMIERGYGRILNVASLAGLVPGSPGQSLYGGSKTFVIQLSQTLHVEAAGKGVHVCALCPGFVQSEFHDVTGTRALVSQMPRYMWMDAERVAREGYDAVMRGKPVHVPGRINKLIAGLANALPHKTALNMMAKRARRFRVQKASDLDL